MALNDFIHDIKSLLNIPKSRRVANYWFATTTINDVYEHFLHVAIHGIPERQCVPWDLLKPSEIKSFGMAVSACSQTAEGEVNMSEFLHLLHQAFPGHASCIQAAQPALRALLYAHARFPFSRPVPLTPTALLRAVMLLTERNALFFSRRAIGPARRTARDRLIYIFNALATSNAGVGIVDREGVVEVLTRLPFPLPSHATLGCGKRRDDFERMAERLDPSCDVGVEKPVQVTTDILAPLASLTASFTGGAQEDPGTAASSSLTVEQFITWATTVQLLRVLDQLFDVMLQPGHDVKSEK